MKTKLKCNNGQFGKRKPLLLERYSWGDYYNGTLEQLAAARVIDETVAKRAAGEAPRYASMTFDLPAGGSLKINRNGNRFIVRHQFNKEQVRLRREHEERIARYEAKQKFLACLPSNASAYRADVRRLCEFPIAAIRNTLIQHHSNGYRLSGDVQADVSDALATIADALRDGEVEYEPALRQEQLAQWGHDKVPEAIKDAKFQSFVAKLLRRAKAKE